MADLVLFNIVTFHSQATQLTVDGCMNVLDVSFKVTARYRLIALLAENYVPLAVNLMYHKVILGNVSLATATKVPKYTKNAKIHQRILKNHYLYTIKCLGSKSWTSQQTYCKHHYPKQN